MSDETKIHEVKPDEVQEGPNPEGAQPADGNVENSGSSGVAGATAERPRARPAASGDDHDSAGHGEHHEHHEHDDHDSIWKKVRKGVVDGYHIAAEKTDLYSKIGKRRVAIMGINRNMERSFTELGEKVYNLFAADAAATVGDDLAVQEIIEKIGGLEADLTAKEAEIEEIAQSHRDKEAAAREAKTQ